MECATHLKANAAARKDAATRSLALLGDKEATNLQSRGVESNSILKIPSKSQ